MAQKSLERVAQKPFRTATWNMYNFTPVEQSEPVLASAVEWGVQLFLVVEAIGSPRDRLFKSFGLEVAHHAQHLIAWDPKRFRLLKQWHANLSETSFFEKNGDVPLFSKGQAVLLEDLETGLTLEAWTYHPPAHTQRNQDEPGYPIRRYKALIETMVFLADRAENTEADGFVAAGDDNWDEDPDGGFQTADVNAVLLGEETGLKQIQADLPTFGKREIDDYRVRFVKLGGSVKPTGLVRVRPGGGAEKPAHQIHEREWVMLAEPVPVEPLKSLRKVAREVIDGKWGVGEDRRVRLTEAGYNYDAVQAKVEKLLTPPTPPEPEPVEHPCPACGVVHLGVVKAPSR